MKHGRPMSESHLRIVNVIIFGISEGRRGKMCRQVIAHHQTGHIVSRLVRIASEAYRVCSGKPLQTQEQNEIQSASHSELADRPRPLTLVHSSLLRTSTHVSKGSIHSIEAS